jgi:TusA-related sulfurtransferase
MATGGELMKGEPRKRMKSREEKCDEPFMEMCKALDNFGPREILNVLVENALQDEIVLQLLLRFPTVVSFSEFLHTLPTIKVSKRIFKKLQREGCVI